MRNDPQSRAERKTVARIGAYASWAKTADWSARTQPARTAFLDRFQREVDPSGVLSPGERARRAEQAKKAYFTKLALRSAQARRRGDAPAITSTDD